jgi:hypothetical protein
MFTFMKKALKVLDSLGFIGPTIYREVISIT